VTVSVADVAVTNRPDVQIVTHALGSCIGVTVYDPDARVGGMLHFMLPTSATNKEKARDKPAMFGDTGIPLLFNACYDLGAKKSRVVVCAAGGAEVLADDGHFKIGSRNRTLLRKLFWKNNILLAADDTGGNISRTLVLNMADGLVCVRNKGQERVIWPL
jgi:chemotaxis protein CheD